MDAECCYDSGKFFMGRLPSCLPGLFTVRFTAPADYSAGDVVVVKGKELPVRTPGMTAAISDIFKAGAVIHCDIDLDRELAFFWQSGASGTGSGILPNLSYEEQFAGFFDADGRKVYSKLVNLGNLFASPIGRTDKAFDPGIENLYSVVELRVRRSSSPGRIIFDCIFDSDASIFYYTNESKIWVAIRNFDASNHTAIAHIYYTCTDR